MKTKLSILLLTVVLLFSLSRCSKPHKPSTLKTENLPAKSFQIDLDKDIVISTTAGLRITIPKGTITASGKNIVLKIREALTLADMIKAGLTTMTDGRLLSSGGMFCIETEDNSAKINSAIKVEVPTAYYEGMSLYEGVTDKDGKINWENPQPIETPAAAVNPGEKLFNENCTSCHALENKVIGPALAHITKVRDLDWLYSFTLSAKAWIYGYAVRSPRVEEADSTSTRDYQKDMFYSRWSHCLNENYSMTEQPDFKLSEQELKEIYSYIEGESDRQHLPIPKDEFFHCFDSCYRYETMKEYLKEMKNMLIKDNGNRLTVTNTIPDSILGRFRDGTYDVVRVVPPTFQAKYYVVNINTWGWRNIDSELRDIQGFEDSRLIVQLSGNYNKSVNVYLAIADYKIFSEGGLLSNSSSDYGFYAKNSSGLPLPQRRQIFVFAIGESDNNLVFAKQQFAAALNQSITLEPKEVSREEFDEAIKSIARNGMEIKAEASKNTEQIHDIEKQLEAAEKLKPNCDCDCSGKDTTRMDTSKGLSE
jgi:hypothetical protein